MSTYLREYIPIHKLSFGKWYSRFLDYAKRQARIEDSGNLFFSDIVPVAATAPNVAAMAFYHTLVLASKKAIEVVGQAEPYGEVYACLSYAVHARLRSANLWSNRSSWLYLNSCSENSDQSNSTLRPME